MTARTFSTARKIHVGEDGILWRLEFDASLNIEHLGLQNWRVLGGGRAPKDQIREYAEALHGLASKEGENTLLPESGSSKDNVSSDSVRMTEEISVCGHSQSAAHSPVKEANEMQAPSSARGASPSAGSEFVHEKGPREAKEVTAKDSYNFKIFRFESRERRDCASITELEFQPEGACPLTRTLVMECHTNENSSEQSTLTIDAWTMMQDGPGSLGLYVRDANRSWIKLWNPSEGHEASLRDALIISRFLELAMTLTTSNTSLYIEELLSKFGSDEDEIKRVLSKYYDSVVKTFLQLETVPMSLRSAPIINKMETLLRSAVGQDTSPATASGMKRKRTCESHLNTGSDEEDQEMLQKRATAKSASTKRKRVVESDSENDSDVGIAQTRPATPTSAGHPTAATATIDDGPSRSTKVDMTGLEGLAFQDVDGIYGGDDDGLGNMEDEDHEDLGDSALCTICDDGGDLLFCDGECMRSFHASKRAAAQSDSHCRSLGFTTEEVQEMGSWLCPNCVQKKHQCSLCGELGSSARQDPQVFACDVALCGRFYHPECYVKYRTKEVELTKSDKATIIASFKNENNEFCCPAHRCRRCGEGETEGPDNSRKLAKCRRCPKSYHKSCLPRKISFELIDDEPIRAWEIPDDHNSVKLIIIYCLNHPIDEELSTPKRDHLKWPDGRFYSLSRFKLNKLELIRKQTKLLAGKSLKEKVVDGRNSSSSQDKSALLATKRPTLPSKPSAGPPDPARNRSLEIGDNKRKDHKIFFATKDPVVTEEQENRVRMYLTQAADVVTIDIVKEELKQPQCYGENKKRSFMHRGELQSVLNAVKKAHEKVKNGGSVEDAKNLCPREPFMQLLRNEEMLRVHLAPILHGSRYTSFGRHFTQVVKLKEIIERIHPYVDDGDMVVDFCCGANDFSVLLKEKLVSVGKTCHFMNFDIHPPKNKFCFTKGDWLANNGAGFLEGKKLIMGLNPPFGVRASLANRFIVHALRFRPKLLVLIVPEETMSFSQDFKIYNYKLVFEDRKLLAGHAFYLPGSVDNTDKQNKSQWNIKPPPLYLWSSADTFRKHLTIALQCKHEGVPPYDISANESLPPSPPCQPPSSGLPLTDPSLQIRDGQGVSRLETRLHVGELQTARFPAERARHPSSGQYHAYPENAPFPGRHRIRDQPGDAGRGGPFRPEGIVHEDFMSRNLHHSMPNAFQGPWIGEDQWRPSPNLHPAMPDMIPERWARGSPWGNQGFPPAPFPPHVPGFHHPPPPPPPSLHGYAHTRPIDDFSSYHAAPGFRREESFLHGQRPGRPGFEQQDRGPPSEESFLHGQRPGRPGFEQQDRGPLNDGTGGWLD